MGRTFRSSITFTLEALDNVLSGVLLFSPKPLSVRAIAVGRQASCVLHEASILRLCRTINEDVGSISPKQ